VAKLFVPPTVPRSIIPPCFVQEKACASASPVMVLSPTTWPAAFTAVATLKVPPRVPRSTAVGV
jgi:hypothetical protein